MSWDTTATSAATGSNVITFVVHNTNSAATGEYTGIVTGYSNGFVRYSGGYSGITGSTVTTYGCGNVGGVSGWGQARRGFAPEQVRELRSDFDAVKENWKRKRAEVRARRLFRRVVGDVAYRKFRQRGYHEICGASHTRYRLVPGKWIRVMEEDERNSEQIKHLLCAHLPFGVPWFDTMAIQHLMLTSSKETEKRFLGIANVHEVEGPYPIPELRVAA